VITPGQAGADFARQDPQKAKRYGHIVPHAPRVRTRSRSPAEGKEEEGDDDIGQVLTYPKYSSVLGTSWDSTTNEISNSGRS
jgi:hypothetical protein